MQYLKTYSSSDSEEDNNKCKEKICNRNNSKPNLPKASTLLGQKRKLELDCSNDIKHQGRTRSFEHVRGNWATYVYMPVNISILEEIQESLQTVCKEFVELHTCTDLHISLSRTVVLQYHLIKSFTKSLFNSISIHKSFQVCLQHLKFYTNDERTRTFIALSIDDVYREKLKQLLISVNDVMNDYKLPLFYKDPSFHISILWCLGDKLSLLNNYFTKLQTTVHNVNENNESIWIDIKTIYCKCGSKDFKFNLK